MITLSILINGRPLFSRSAHRRSKRHARGVSDAYFLDTGEVIYHDRKDGAIVLAKKMLDTIKESDKHMEQIEK